MNAYRDLAASYDRLTNDVDYVAVVAFYKEILSHEGKLPRTAVDLACGTASIAKLLAEDGLQVTAVDLSEDMLAVAWEKTAEFICKYFLKGSRIVIEGRLQSTNYTDDKGVKRYGVDVIVENVEFGGSKKPAATNDYGNSFYDEVYFG